MFDTINRVIIIIIIIIIIITIIVIILACFWLSGTGQIWGFRAFSGE